MKKLIKSILRIILFPLAFLAVIMNFLAMALNASYNFLIGKDNSHYNALFKAIKAIVRGAKQGRNIVAISTLAIYYDNVHSKRVFEYINEKHFESKSKKCNS